MKKASLFIITSLLGSFLLAGCTSPTAPKTSTPVKSTTPAAAQKSGTTTKTGQITNKGGKFYIQEANKQPEEIDSYSIDLNTYVGQSVTIEGQFSGNTLFVGSVK
jgi:outer membrane biogenesis lipoprotein LolB